MNKLLETVPYLIRSIDVRMKVWRWINYRAEAGAAAIVCCEFGSLALFIISMMLTVIWLFFSAVALLSSWNRPPGVAPRRTGVLWHIFHLHRPLVAGSIRVL